MMSSAMNLSPCTAILVTLLASVAAPAKGDLPYTTYTSFADLMAGDQAQYPKLIRISEPGTKDKPVYTGFFFYQCLQFDPTDRYVLGMRVYCQNRDVRPTDRGEIGVIDLQDEYKWMPIGETTAWNWQQGARAQWRPGSSEILWNDRSDDGSHYVCRVYDFKTGVRRTLPRPIYTPSPDGRVALTHDFERMKHGGTPYVGIKDKYADQYAPKETGIWKMDLNTGEASLVMSLEQMARIAFPDGAPSSGSFYIFREGWNPSGSRFIAFVKDLDNKYDRAFSMTADGTDVRRLHDRPSHHEWRDDNTLLDGRYYYLYRDDGTGKARDGLFESSYNGHVSYIPGPGGDWIISDTYAIEGYQYLFLYHIPTKRFVPLAKLKSTAPTNTYRVDLHPRLSRSGRIVSIDATHEGLGRQMYLLDIGYLLDHPPVASKSPEETPRELFRAHLADYDSELRRPDGRVDLDAMVSRLKELGVTTYYWLIWHASTDWEDLKLFLPKAAEAGIDVWPYLVPPSESPPKFGSHYSEPFRLDYRLWAEEIARLSLEHANLTAWVIDDFYANHEFFTPDYLREMQTRAKRVNPRLAFLPLMYFDEMRPKFAADYREVIDGVVVAYLQDREEIDWTWAILNDAAVVPPGDLAYPWDTPSQAGDFVMASQSAKVLPADRYVLSFRERDDFTGPTAGYHFKQVLVDGTVVWEQDVAEGSPAWQKIGVDITERTRGKAAVTVALRLFDKKGVSNFGVRWRLSELRAEGLQLGGDLTEPSMWRVDRQGAFETGFGEGPQTGLRRFHIPFISMTAGDQSEFRQRHGEPATPERVAEHLRMSLQAWREGKCDGVVTYCLDKRPQSRIFALARDLFHQFGGTRGGTARPVPLWGRFETTVVNSGSYANPFTDVELVATFTRPDKSQVRFWGFHDGDGHGGQAGNIWKLRFMPDQVGPWSYECSFSDGTPGQSGTFDCVAEGAQPGPLRADPANPHCWVFADGSHFFPRAYTAPELFVAANRTHRTHWIDYFFGGKHKFNLCNANLLNFVGIEEELNWQGTPYKAPDPAQEDRYVTIGGNGLFPFLYSGPRPLFDGGSNVDWLRPSVRCWSNVDEILGELEARKVVWFNHWGMLGWDWSGNGRLLVPPAARKAVLRYWIARLAPYWNVTWNLAGEWDELLTPTEFDELGTFLQEMDPWKHPLTSHALGTTVNRPWVDFRVQQFSAGTSSDAVTNATRAAADYANKPVLAFETSWEATPGKLTPDQVRTGAWGSLMGGAFYLYAECFEPTLTWGDGSAFDFIETMNDFLGGLTYWKLTPNHALVNSGSLCLADPGREYVVYRQSGGTIVIDLPGAGRAFQAEWLDPRTGARKAAAGGENSAKQTYLCPDARDWVLHLSREE